MTLSMLKSFRDGGITGGTTAVVMMLLLNHGADAETAAVAGMIAGGIAARLYRYGRARWPWLEALDPPAEENKGQ